MDKRLKTVLSTLMMAMLPLSSVNAKDNAEDIPLQVEYVDPTGNQGSRPRTPVARPNVSIDGHTLYLYHVGYDLALVLLDEDGEAVYTTFVPAGTSAVMLPATLSGDYEIQLYPDGSSYYFYGWVEL